MPNDPFYSYDDWFISDKNELVYPKFKKFTLNFNIMTLKD